MIKKINLVRLSIFFLLVILFPLVQDQWLNLYLFDKNNFTIYKFLYYLSGLILPIFVCFTSLDKFTVYTFRNNILNNNYYIRGQSLLTITGTSLVIFSTIISYYLYINFKIIFNLIISNSSFLKDVDITNLFLFVIIISILLFFKKTKLFIKRIILINYLLLSFVIWYSEIHNIILTDTFLFNSFIKFDNINVINTFYLLSIEILFYLWSYISYSSYLSDWSIPLPDKKAFPQLFNVIFFYIIVILYYVMVSN